MKCKYCKIKSLHRGKTYCSNRCRNLASGIKVSFAGRKHTKETIEKIIKAKTGVPSPQRGKRGIGGPAHYNWKGGLTKRADSRLRQLQAWKDWRKSVFTRDNFTCRWCGARGCYIEPHHVKPKRKYPALVFKLNNGITLCRPCHNKTLGKEEKLEAQFRAMLSNPMK